MLNENQEKIIKEELNKYINNIKIPENLEGIIMEDMNKIKNDEANENQNREKNFSATKAIGVAAAVVIVAGVVGVTGLKIGMFDNKSQKNAIAENHSESGIDIKTASGDKIKSLYDIEEYTSNLTDSANGKLAFLKLLENDELQTEKHADYYTYIDQFENKYNIKEITNVTSEKGTMGKDNWAALFKVTVTYVDNNNKTNTMDLAILLLPDHEVQNRGTYLNFTGTTSYVKGFTNSLVDNKVSDKRIRELADMYLKMRYAGSERTALEILGFKNTNVKYSNYKEKILQYFASDCFNRNQSDDIDGNKFFYDFDTDNGYIKFSEYPGDSGNDTEITSITEISSNKYKINYNSNARGDKSNIIKSSIIVTVKLENGKYVISDVIDDKNSIVDTKETSNANEFSHFVDLV